MNSVAGAPDLNGLPGLRPVEPAAEVAQLVLAASGRLHFPNGTNRADLRESERRTHSRNDAQLRQLNEDRPGRDANRAVVTLRSETITVTRAINLVIDDFNRPTRNAAATSATPQASNGGLKLREPSPGPRKR